MPQDGAGTSPASPTALSHVPWPIPSRRHALQVPQEEGDSGWGPRPCGRKAVPGSGTLEHGARRRFAAALGDPSEAY